MKARKTMIADPTMRAARVELGGQQFSLAFDFNAIAAAEAATGLNLLQALEFQGLNAGQFRALFYASLLKLQPEMSLEDAGTLITMMDLPKITNALLAAWNGSMPEKGPDKGSEPSNPLAPEPAPASHQ